MEISENNNQYEVQNLEQQREETITKKQKQKVIAILFGRLLRMHKNIMTILSIFHLVILLSVCLHMFTLGNVESENKYCYITWPLMHMSYAFMNYIYCWFCCYNSCEISSKGGHELINVSKKFLKIFTIFCFVPFPLKFLAERMCRNWTFSTEAVLREFLHLFVETLLLNLYFQWFEKKYLGFRLIYKETQI